MLKAELKYEEAPQTLSIGTEQQQKLYMQQFFA